MPTFLGEGAITTPPPRKVTRAPTISGDTTPKITKWSANCFFRFVNAIVACRDAYIEYYGTANKVTLDAHDVKGPWEAIALLYRATPPVDGEQQYKTRLRVVKTQRLEAILRTAESSAESALSATHTD